MSSAQIPIVIRREDVGRGVVPTAFPSQVRKPRWIVAYYSQRSLIPGEIRGWVTTAGLADLRAAGYRCHRQRPRLSRQEMAS